MTEHPRAVSPEQYSISREEGMRSPILLKGQTLWQRPSKFVLSPMSGKADGKPSSGAAGVKRGSGFEPEGPQ